MIEHFSPSRLRANLYRILDSILETGKPVVVKRKGQLLKIEREKSEKLDLLKPHPDYLKVPREDIVHMDWSQEWRP
jgi:hypothetical protein